MSVVPHLLATEEGREDRVQDEEGGDADRSVQRPRVVSQEVDDRLHLHSRSHGCQSH